MQDIIPTSRSIYFNSTLVKATQTLTSDATNPDANGTITLGTQTYTLVANLTAAVAASGTLTSDNTNVTDGDSFVIGTRTYTLVETLPAYNEYETAFYIKIGANADATLLNIKNALNGDAATWGVTRTKNITADPLVTCGNVTAHAITVTARTAGAAGNAIATTEASTHLSWGAATLESGVDTVANQIKIGASAAVTLDNIKAAVNGAAGAGTTYSTSTVANASVTATTNTDTTQVFEALVGGTAGNSIASTEDATHLAFGATALAGGGGTVGRQTVGQGMGGKINRIVSICPQLAGTPTYTIKIEDRSGNVVYTSGNLNENATSDTAYATVLADDDVLVLTASGTVESTLPVIVSLR